MEFILFIGCGRLIRYGLLGDWIMTFLSYVGLATCVLISLLAIWILYTLFVHPVLQAVSLTRWYTACMNKISEDISFFSKCKIFIYYYEVGGLSFESTRNRVGWWRGIGDWGIYPDDSE